MLICMALAQLQSLFNSIKINQHYKGELRTFIKLNATLRRQKIFIQKTVLTERTLIFPHIVVHRQNPLFEWET